MKSVCMRRPADSSGKSSRAFERQPFERRHAREDFLAVRFVEVFENEHGVVAVEFGNPARNGGFGQELHQIETDVLVDLGQRFVIEMITEQRDELQALVSGQRFEHVAEVGRVQGRDQFTHLMGVFGIDQLGKAVEPVGVEVTFIVTHEHLARVARLDFAHIGQLLPRSARDGR